MIDLQQAGAGLEGYALLAAQLESLLADERDFIANASQFSAFLYNELPELNWAGFYLNKQEELVLGPFQGKVACVRIPFTRASAAPRHAPARPSVSRTCMPSRPHCLRQRVQQRAGGAPGEGRQADRRARPRQPERRSLQRGGPGRHREPGGDLPAPDRLLIGCAMKSPASAGLFVSAAGQSGRAAELGQVRCSPGRTVCTDSRARMRW